MRKIYSILLSAMMISIMPAKLLAQVDLRDSLALVDLYYNTDGAHWKRNNNWLTDRPVKTWYGVKVVEQKVFSIYLPNNRLKGRLPVSIGDFSAIKILDLSVNKKLHGNLPTSIGRLTNLTSLVLAECAFTGNIPFSIGNLINVDTLHFADNQISGSIPESIGNMTALKFLDISQNQLGGSIPNSIGNLNRLERINLSHNKLSGSIPSSIGRLSNLKNLSLEYNQFCNSLPASIGNLVSIQELSLHNNELSGSIPASIGNLVNLLRLYIYNNKLNGNLPASISGLAKVELLYLNNNQISGRIPSTIQKLATLIRLDLSNNELTGTVPSFSSNRFASYNLYNNQLSGNLPTLASVYISINIGYNEFNFNGLEPIAEKYPYLTYSPQANIPVQRQGNIFSVAAGGTLGNNTYKWYRNGLLIKEAIGDSTFKPTMYGSYFATVTNSRATKLTLYSDTITVTGFAATPLNDAVKYQASGTQLPTISLTPNPAKDFLNIHFGNTTGNAAISIYDEGGKKVFITQMAVNSGQMAGVNISKLTPGNYFISVNINEEMIKEQFIKVKN